MQKTVVVNQERLWSRLMEMAKIGATPLGGSCRLALTEEDRQGRDLFIEWSKELGCDIKIDRMGNIFAIRPGKDPKRLPVSCGSHLDTQPHGGKFDGVYGVLAGLEVFATLNENNIETASPLQVCVWTNEEGSRFSPPMISSGVYGGVYELDYALGRVDEAGITLGEALEKIDYKGEIDCGSNQMGAFIEVHIEQGPILERNSETIGVVTGVQGSRWYQVWFEGRDAHTGSTPMAGRQDALLSAAHAIAKIKEIALAHAPDAVATVGRIEAYPNSHNTIPGKVFFTVDMRNPEEETLDQMEKQLYQVIEAAAKKESNDFKIEVISKTPPIKFNDNCIEIIEKATRKCNLKYRRMISGAGHDACHISKVAPTAMIFIPCAEGISHNETESATKEDLAAGTQILLETLVELADQ